ncbi:MAG: class II aldolase/adducin family protein [Chloroflexi bacterium]|nr:class II aldolase/adducin family protein [Chloroflexota bacterium]
MDVTDILRELSDAAAELVRRGLVLASGGNVSFRQGDVVYISPTGSRLNALSPELFAQVAFPTGESLNAFKPSSELPMHLAAYQVREEARVIIHCHPPHLIALSALGWELPPMTADFFLYLNAERLPVVPYITPGTEELAHAVAEKLGEAPAVILGNHGILVTGPNVDKALTRVLLAEEMAYIYLTARQFGEPRVLTAADWHALKASRYRQTS